VLQNWCTYISDFIISHFAYRNTVLKKPVVLLSTGKSVKATAMCPTDGNKFCPSWVSSVKMSQWKQYTCQFHITSAQMIPKLQIFHMCTDTEYFTAVLQSSRDQFTDNWVYQQVYSANLKYTTSSCFSLFIVHTPQSIHSSSLNIWMFKPIQWM